MTDNKEKKDDKNLNNPFNQFNPNKKDGKAPKFNAYWIYGVIAIVFIVVQFYFTTSRGPVKTTWNEVRSTMLVNQDIERIVVVNDKMATVYIKRTGSKSIKHNLIQILRSPLKPVHTLHSILVRWKPSKIT
jgi:AFG3 family protein